LRLAASPPGADDPPSLGFALRLEQTLIRATAIAAMPGARDPAALAGPAQRIGVGGQFDQGGKLW
jgi:hypothetical protein